MTATSRILRNISEAIGGELVFGSPVTTGDITVIPAARLIGGGGGGEGTHATDDDDTADPGGGAGFGVIARPVGALVIEGGRVRWKPTIDVTRMILGAQAVVAAYFVSTWLIARTNAKAAIKIAQLG